MIKVNILAISLIALLALQTHAVIDPDKNPLFYIGCYNSDDFIIKVPFNFQTFDVTSCRDHCLTEGYDYAGLEHNGATCYCTDFIPAQKIHEYYCRTACYPEAIDGTEICGGYHSLSLYQSSEIECIGGACTVLDFQQCHNKLGDLESDDVSTSCTPYFENDYYFYEQHIQIDDFVVDGSCTSMTLSLENKEIPLFIYDNNTGQYWQGQGFQNSLQPYEGFFDPLTHQLGFSIEHSTMEDVWGCAFEKIDNVFRWQCDYSLIFYFLGFQQFEYKCTVEFNIERDVTKNGLGKGECNPQDPQCLNVPDDPPEIVIIPDTPITVEGECCDNELSVQTSLYFCLDNTDVSQGCLGQTNNPQIFERMEEIYLKHEIDTSEFQGFYLDKVQINIGYFVTLILDWDNSNPGYIIYKISSNIAFDTKIITVYSLLVHPDDIRRRRNRRMLAGDEGVIRDDYYLEANNQLLVKPDDDQRHKDVVIDHNPNQTEEEGISPAAIGILSAGISVFVLGMIGATIIYIKKKKKGEKMKKFELESQRSSIKDNMSQSCKESQRNIKQSSASDLEKPK